MSVIPNDQLVIELFDQIPEEIKSLNNFKSVDYFFAYYFWENCASDWHDKFTHKVYAIYSKTTKLIYGFFSLIANNIMITDSSIVDKENSNIPILDIAFIDVSESLEEETAKTIFKGLLEYIEMKISPDITNKIGCRYIRTYIPTYPQKNEQGADVPGEPLFPFLEDLLIKNLEYIDPPVSESKKIRRIKDKENKKQFKLVLKYFLRDILN